VQLAPAASEVPQVVADFTNELAPVPVMVSDVSEAEAVPVFLTVTTWAAVVAPTAVEAKARLVGDTEIAAAPAATPVPERETVCVPTLSATASVAVSAPEDAGLNSTETVQLAPAASEVPQVVADFTNELELVPLTVSDVSEAEAVPVFLTVTTWAAVVTPTVVEAKLRLVGETEMAAAPAATPLPERETVCVPALSTQEKVAGWLPVAWGSKVKVKAQEAPAASVPPQVVLAP